MNNLTWEEILKSFTANPRDVITRENGIWFHVYGDGKYIYVEAAKNHVNSSKITMRRRLDCENFEKIYNMYLKKISRSEVRYITRNYSYWFGIFSTLENKN